MLARRALPLLLLLTACEADEPVLDGVLEEAPVASADPLSTPATRGELADSDDSPSTIETSDSSCPALVIEELSGPVSAAPGEALDVELPLRNACTEGPELRIDALALSEGTEGFEILSSAEELVFGPGATGTVQLRFAPSSTGLEVSELALRSNDPSVPVTRATLVGIGGVMDTVSGAAPIAATGGNQTVTTGATVTLDGTSSSDPEGDTLTYSWTFQSVPAGSALTNASITDASSSIASFVPDVDGAYRVRFVVSDGTSVDKDFDWVWASSASNTAPTAEAGPLVDATTGSAATVDASASSDPQGDTLSYHWSFKSVPAGSALTNASFADATAVSTTFTPDVDGDYRVRLVVSDGSLSDKDFVWVRAWPPNDAPTAEAGAAQTGATGDTHTVDASASSDPDGDTLSYEWSFRTVPSGSALTNADIVDSTSAQASFTSDVDGRYRLRLVVSDGRDVGKDFVNVDTATATATGSGASATGEQGIHAPNFLLGQQLTLASDLTLSGLGIGMDAGGVNVVLALYEDDGGTPGDLVAQTDSEAVSAGSNTLDLSGTDVALTAGDYWIMKVSDDVAYVTESSAEGTSNNTVWGASTFSGTAPDPAGVSDTMGDHLMALWILGY